MRLLTTVAGVLLAISFSIPGMATQDNSVGNRPAVQSKKKAVHPAPHPSWEQCYAMSRERGFDHEHDEWPQSIEDCQAGKIPL